MSVVSTLASRADHELARAIASQTGTALMGLRNEAEGSIDSDTLRTEADRMANEIIIESLQARIADGDGLLSEESPDDLGRLDRERVWIVDPLDGTREFGEPERTDWAVHVGLAVDNVATVGAVALPAMGTVVSTGDPPHLPESNSAPVRMAVSRTRAPEQAELLHDKLGYEIVAMGSAGAKAMAVVRGEVDAYVHAGGQYEWDSCAPAAVAAASGLHVSRLDGSPLRYNQANPFLPDLVICRPELAESILVALDR
jgi:3'(2'), 5'-bisphosphate nucleotidase